LARRRHPRLTRRDHWWGKETVVPIEHEAKILNIDPTEIVRCILDKGGHRVARRSMRRHVYDITPGNPSKWIRLRDTGSEVTLTVKEILHDGIDGTHETEVVVSDFEATNALLEMLGYHSKAYQENERVSFILDNAQVEIDTWPLIPPYIEIEAATKDEVIRVAELLGYTETDLTGENTTKVYARYDIDLSTISELRFR
jgi:adenylate cyclase class 2